MNRHPRPPEVVPAILVTLGRRSRAGKTDPALLAIDPDRQMACFMVARRRPDFGLFERNLGDRPESVRRCMRNLENDPGRLSRACAVQPPIG